MANLPRVNSNVEAFASNATGTNRTVFGGNAQSDSIDDNLNADFLTGWEIVNANAKPTKQDFNALGFTLSTLIAYLYQSGVPEWNVNQEYCAGSIVNIGGVLYSAVQDSVGVDPVADAAGAGANWVETSGGSDLDIDGLPDASGAPLADDDRILFSDTSDGGEEKITTVEDLRATLATDYIHVSERQPSGVESASNSGGASNTWVSRVINTVEANTLAGASLAGNAVNLPAGTYRTRFVTQVRTGSTVIRFNTSRLRDVTNGATVAVGQSNIKAAVTGQHQILYGEGEFTLAGAASIEFQVFDFFQRGGNSVNAGEPENYLNLIIERVS